MCRASEKAVEGMNHLRNEKGKTESVQAVSYNQPKPVYQHYQYQKQRNQSRTPARPPAICRFCVRSHPYGREHCPAWGQTCSSCKQRNHFAASSICRKKRVQEIQDTSPDADQLGPFLVNSLFLGSINDQDTTAVRDWTVSLKTNNGSLNLKIDTGADVSVIGEDHLLQMGLTLKDIKPTAKTLCGPDNNELQCLGYVTTDISSGSLSSQQTFYVCPKVTKGLLGKPAIKALNLLRIDSTTTTHNFIKEFPQVFSGLGKMAGPPIKIQLIESITPYHLSAPRHVALPLLQPLKDELDRMMQLGVIKKVDEPTEWCHPIVLVRKENGGIRLCIDLTKLNDGVKREFYQLESVDETLSKLGKDCNVMSKLDANSGYWQIPLDEESQLKATFITPFGRYCPTRAPFGLTSMHEIFNKRLDGIIEGLDGIVKSTDDLLVFGKNPEEHDERMQTLLRQLALNGVTLNTSKCKFNQTEVEFLGHHISPEGIQPVDNKLDAIKEFKQPQNVTELRRFMGMAQQLSKFTPHLAEVSTPLRDLLSTKNAWVWTQVHQIAFQKTKEVLTTKPVLGHYDISKQTKIRTDGSSKNGISAILYQKHAQDWKPVAYASRFLTPTEANYHPIEVEMLAIVWGCEKMSKYIHGLPDVTLETDHKPLIPIINNKPLHDMSP